MVAVSLIVGRSSFLFLFFCLFSWSFYSCRHARLKHEQFQDATKLKMSVQTTVKRANSIPHYALFLKVGQKLWSLLLLWCSAGSLPPSLASPPPPIGWCRLGSSSFLWYCLPPPPPFGGAAFPLPPLPSLWWWCFPPLCLRVVLLSLLSLCGRCCFGWCSFPALLWCGAAFLPWVVFTLLPSHPGLFRVVLFGAAFLLPPSGW